MDARQKERWETKGRRFSLGGVMEQARISVALSQEHQDALTPHGWTAERTDTLTGRLDSLNDIYVNRSSKVDASRSATRTEAECKRDAKAHIKKLRLTVPMVLRDHPAPGVTEAAFKVGKTLGTSTKRISKYLLQIRPLVSALEQPLTVYFAGESPLVILDRVKANLDASDTTQETYRAGLPVSTVRLYALSGEIIEMLGDLNRIAKLAFHDSPELAALFNTNLIQRAFRPKKKEDGMAEAV